MVSCPRHISIAVLDQVVVVDVSDLQIRGKPLQHLIHLFALSRGEVGIPQLGRHSRCQAALSCNNQALAAAWKPGSGTCKIIQEHKCISGFSWHAAMLSKTHISCVFLSV